jgi:hypothetical protein
MKRNLVYVSFVLMVGLLGLTGTAFAQSTVFGVSSSIDQVRHEGLAEATGQVVLTSSSTGAIVPGSLITLTYGTNLAVKVTNANVTCSVACGAGVITVTGAVGQPVVVISFSGAANYSPGPGGTMTISGIRVNANALSSGPINATVAASVPAAFAASNAITFSTNTTVEVGNVNPLATTVTLSEGPAALLSCVAEAAPIPIQFSIVENFAQALTSAADENGLSGGGATQGSNILVTFTGVPKGVTIAEAVPAEDASSSATLIVAADPSTNASQTATTANATLTYLFDVNATNTTAIETLLLDFTVMSPILPTGLMPNSITATVSLTSLPTAAAAVPTFTGNEAAVTAVAISDCITNLLFPWVAVDAPGGTFDTGIAIANTTLDPFVTGGAVPQTGSCLLTGYNLTGGAPVTTAVGPVPAGETGTVVLSSLSAFAGFRGYIISVCQFQNAHAFAFITQDNMTATGTSQGYLALVIPNPSIMARNPAGGGQGESLAH